MIYYIAAPGLATSDSTQALQAAAFPTIPYPGVGQYHLSHNGKQHQNFILGTLYQPSLDASVYLNVLFRSLETYKANLSQL